MKLDMSDLLDYQIMELLAEDGRMSSAEMARRLDLPVRTVRYRLDRLLKNDVVKVRPIVNPAAFGYAILADVLIETEAGKVFEVANTLSHLDMVSYVACATGDQDVSLQVVAKDVDSLYKFVTDKIHSVTGVRHTKTILLPVKLKDVYQWYPPNPYVLNP